MIIALGSQSSVKQEAVRRAMQVFEIDAQLVTVKARSNVAEQPFNSETVRGARNRALHAAALVPDAAFALAIESGIFDRNGHYLDIAVVVARLRDGRYLQADSQSVEFPADAVHETVRRCVENDSWTVGKILQEWGRIERHDDPHASLVGRSRAAFIYDAVFTLIQTMHLGGLL